VEYAADSCDHLRAGQIRFRVWVVLLLTISLGIALPLAFHYGESVGWWLLVSEALGIVLTTVFAVASAGFAKGSVKGAMGALFGAWTTLIGCALVWGGVRERSLLGLAVGAGYVVLGVSLWLISVF
jgi:hypothetical protein